MVEKTGDEHTIRTNDLITILAENGFSANCKTIRDDMEILCEFGNELLYEARELTAKIFTADRIKADNNKAFQIKCDDGEITPDGSGRDYEKIAVR